MAWNALEPRWDMRSWVDEVEPDETYFVQPSPDEFDAAMQYEARWVTWIGTPGTMVKVDADMVPATPQNPFNFEHLAYIKKAVETASGNLVLEAPAARFLIVDEGDVAESQEADDDGRIEELGMTRPWEDDDIGQTYVQLLDGNHRAFGAIYAGEPFIWVTIGPNYRADAAAAGALE